MAACLAQRSSLSTVLPSKGRFDKLGKVVGLLHMDTTLMLETCWGVAQFTCIPSHLDIWPQMYAPQTIHIRPQRGVSTTCFNVVAAQDWLRSSHDTAFLLR
ncbi:hypothetical protein V2G26_015010 [Clonostachys chloroleuca]